MWQGDEYVYSKGELKAIATNYEEITMSAYYTKQEFEGGGVSYNPILDYKVDFDTALNAIGRGRWTGDIEDKFFSDFRHFGRLQIVVISDIYGVIDYELEENGFYQVPRLKGYAYSQMARYLNGLPLWGARSSEAKTLDKRGIMQVKEQ